MRSVLLAVNFQSVVHYAIRIDWMIWNMAEPHTTKMNNASNHGPTGYFSSALLVDLGTLPRWVMLRLAFSLAMRILCWGAIAVVCVWFSGVKGVCANLPLGSGGKCSDDPLSVLLPGLVEFSFL